MSTSYNQYIDLQLQTVENPLEREIASKLKELAQNSELSAQPLMYSTEQISAILAECDQLVESVPGSKKFWTPNLREKFVDFLTGLPADAYPTPAIVYTKGKYRSYREHVEKLTTFVNDHNAIILDVAGRTGWVSTVLAHLGYPRAVTIELNPINVIGGRYIWGHQSVIQGDAQQLRNCRPPQLNLQEGNLADVIFCRYALEHFRNLEKVFDEFEYILKPGGKVVLIVGRGVKKKRDFGDLHAFPDAASIYKYAGGLCMTYYSLGRNIDNNEYYYEHFVVLEKPADRDLLSQKAIMNLAHSQNRVWRVSQRIKQLVG